MPMRNYRGLARAGRRLATVRRCTALWYMRLHATEAKSKHTPSAYLVIVFSTNVVATRVTVAIGNATITNTVLLASAAAAHVAAANCCTTISSTSNIDTITIPIPERWVVFHHPCSRSCFFLSPPHLTSLHHTLPSASSLLLLLLLLLAPLRPSSLQLLGSSRPCLLPWGHRALACPQTTSRTQTRTPIHAPAYTNTCTHASRTHRQFYHPTRQRCAPRTRTGTKRATLLCRNQIGEIFRCITFAYLAKLSRRSSSTPWPSTVVPVLDK